MFEDNLSKFKSRPIKRGYLKKLIQRTLSEVNFATRQSALLQKNKAHKRVLPLVRAYQLSVPHLKKILMLKWDLIQNQPLLNTIFRDPPIIAYKRGTSLKDMLIRVKLSEGHIITSHLSRRESMQACLHLFNSMLSFSRQALSFTCNPNKHILGAEKKTLHRSMLRKYIWTL